MTGRLSRRAFVGIGAAAIAAPSLGRGPRRQRGWVGTYTPDGAPADLAVGHPQSAGLYGFELDPATGRLSEVWLASRRASPTNLIAGAGGRTLYACRGGERGEIAALAVDGRRLTELNALPAGGAGPTHGVVDRRGRYLVTTNFASDEVTAFRLEPGGALAEMTARLPSSNAAKSAPPPPGTPLPPLPTACRTAARRLEDGCRTKPHIALFSPSERWVVVAEIATDALAVYRFDPATGALSLHSVAQGQAGGGPRHLAFSPDGRFLYSSDEHGSQVSAWVWNEARGSAALLQTLSTLPAGYTGRNTTAHIALHPSGRALWVSNRGHPSLAGFAVDQRSGRMRAAGHTATGSRDCWCFDIDATGKWLVAALLTADALAVYRVDARTPALEPTGQRVPVPFPTCLRLT